MNIQEIHKYLVDFLKTEFANAGFNKAVIGISGGLDSAVVAYLTKEAIGGLNILGVIMPYKTSSPDSTADAMLVCKTLGLRSRIVDITPMVDEFFDVDRHMNHIRLGNIAARTRMIILYDLSARDNALVVGTSNKTEILLGYGTIYGDTACAINPIGDLYKTQVWELARELGVPEKIISKVPTADLWNGQTDEGELGFTYKEVDKLLIEMIDNKKSDAQLIEMGFDKEFIEKVKNRIKANEFKRRMPLIAKLPK
ncbi:MAG: NAD synthetase [Ignavibacteriae bacterium]|nr:MAG: NAD synthetase [Ignavibacteriota bacterium]